MTQSTVADILIKAIFDKAKESQSINAIYFYTKLINDVENKSNALFLTHLNMIFNLVIKSNLEYDDVLKNYLSNRS
jgi:hypothetical protein